MKAIVSAIILAALIILLASLTPKTNSEKLVRVVDRKELNLLEVLPDLKKSRLIFVGELHDRKNHHDAQLALIRALNEAGVSISIGLEMFQGNSQRHLDKWVEGAISESEFLPVYYSNWNLDWSLYADIFRYAREQKLPMIGLNVRPEIVKQVARKGFASLNAEQKSELPPVTCVVDKKYKEFIQRALGAHGHGNMDFTNFCEAQLLWDAAMAANLVDYLRANPDRVVVVIAGSGHAWKQGIPRQVRSLADIPYRVILPEVSGRSEAGKSTTEDADYLWLHH